MTYNGYSNHNIHREYDPNYGMILAPTPSNDLPQRHRSSSIAATPPSESSRRSSFSSDFGGSEWGAYRQPRRRMSMVESLERQRRDSISQPKFKGLRLPERGANSSSARSPRRTPGSVVDNPASDPSVVGIKVNMPVIVAPMARFQHSGLLLTKLPPRRLSYQPLFPVKAPPSFDMDISREEFVDAANPVSEKSATIGGNYRQAGSISCAPTFTQNNFSPRYNTLGDYYKRKTSNSDNLVNDNLFGSTGNLGSENPYSRSLSKERFHSSTAPLRADHNIMRKGAKPQVDHFVNGPSAAFNSSSNGSVAKARSSLNLQVNNDQFLPPHVSKDSRVGRSLQTAGSRSEWNLQSGTSPVQGTTTSPLRAINQTPSDASVSRKSSTPSLNPNQTPPNASLASSLRSTIPDSNPSTLDSVSNAECLGKVEKNKPSYGLLVSRNINPQFTEEKQTIKTYPSAKSSEPELAQVQKVSASWSELPSRSGSCSTTVSTPLLSACPPKEDLVFESSKRTTITSPKQFTPHNERLPHTSRNESTQLPISRYMNLSIASKTEQQVARRTKDPEELIWTRSAIIPCTDRFLQELQLETTERHKIVVKRRSCLPKQETPWPSPSTQSSSLTNRSRAEERMDDYQTPPEVPTSLPPPVPLSPIPTYQGKEMNMFSPNTSSTSRSRAERTLDTFDSCDEQCKTWPVSENSIKSTDLLRDESSTSVLSSKDASSSSQWRTSGSRDSSQSSTPGALSPASSEPDSGIYLTTKFDRRIMPETTNKTNFRLSNEVPQVFGNSTTTAEHHRPKNFDEYNLISNGHVSLAPANNWSLKTTPQATKGVDNGASKVASPFRGIEGGVTKEVDVAEPPTQNAFNQSQPNQTRSIKSTVNAVKDQDEVNGLSYNSDHYPSRRMPCNEVTKETTGYIRSPNDNYAKNYSTPEEKSTNRSKTEAVPSINRETWSQHFSGLPESDVKLRDSRLLSDDSARSAKTHQSSARGGYVHQVEFVKGALGLGFCIEGGKESARGDLPITVKRLFKGDVAASEVLCAGDEILDVNGQPFTDMSHFEAWNFLKTLPSGIVRMIICRQHFRAIQC